MNASFGLDHQLIAVNDIETTRDYLQSIGFNMTTVGKHPWGTSTSLAMFDGCLIEIMGIFDASLIDENPAGEFKFGRHIYEHLLQREGIALSALHSNNIVDDIEQAKKAGMSLADTLEFGRDVTLPDGKSGRTKTTLAIFPDKDHPRLSVFLCQQHRPELIYVPEWMTHPNKVYGIKGICIVAKQSELEVIGQKWMAMNGNMARFDGGFRVDTANGSVDVMTREAFKSKRATLPAQIADNDAATILAIDYYCENLDKLENCILNSGTKYRRENEYIELGEPDKIGNVYIRFYQRIEKFALLF